jgi:ankyrin repeat protein
VWDKGTKTGRRNPALRKKGVDVNAQNNKGRSPLYLAVKHNYVRLLNYLLFEAEADPRIKDKFGDTILHAAAQHANEETLNILLKSSAQLDINSEDVKGEVPLQNVGTPAAARILCAHGALNKIKGLRKCVEDKNMEQPHRPELFQILEAYDPETDSETKKKRIPVPQSAIETVLEGAKKTTGVFVDIAGKIAEAKIENAMRSYASRS